MSNIYDPMLKAAHDHSFDTRKDIEAGGECGCYHCLHTFPASEVTEWIDNTAVCPNCHIDSVLSANVDLIDQTFLKRMQDAWFNKKSRNPAFAKPVKINKKWRND